MPDVQGLALERARYDLGGVVNRASIRVTRVRSGAKPNTVITQDPDPGAGISSRRDPVWLTVSAGEPRDRQAEPEASDPSTCRDLEDEKRAERKELTAWVREARGAQKTVDELEEELRSYPEDRSKIAPDLRSARRDVQDTQREVRSIQQVFEELDNEGREEGCGR